MSNSSRPHGLQPTRLLYPWDFPGKLSFSVQFSSVAQSCPILCDPMNRSTPGLPVHHQLPEFTQTHDHQVSDAIQPSHPQSSPSPPAHNPSQLLLLLLLTRFSHVRLCATPQTAAHQAPPSLVFSRQEHRSGLPFPSPVHEGEKRK